MAGRAMRLRYAALSDTGLVRPHNEDRWGAVDDEGLFVVADGMGGYNAGEIAAELAVRTACERIRQTNGGAAVLNAAMQSALERCNHEIRVYAAAHPDCLGMGTTIIVCVIRGDRLHVAHIGDSRAYLLRDGLLRRVTRDHSIGQQITDSGALTEDQVRHLPGRGILTRALGVEESVASEINVFDWQPRDTLLLCSDGLTDVVPDQQIEQLLIASAAGGPDGQARVLVEAALKAGGCDNVTALVADEASQAQQEDRAAGAQEPMH